MHAAPRLDMFFFLKLKCKPTPEFCTDGLKVVGGPKEAPSGGGGERYVKAQTVSRAQAETERRFSLLDSMYVSVCERLLFCESVPEVRARFHIL